MTYAGLIPGSAGLYQVKAKVSADTLPGDQALQIFVGDVGSNVATIAVR